MKKIYITLKVFNKNKPLHDPNNNTIIYNYSNNINEAINNIKELEKRDQEIKEYNTKYYIYVLDENHNYKWMDDPNDYIKIHDNYIKKIFIKQEYLEKLERLNNDI